MSKQLQSFEELVGKAASYLRALSYADLSVQRFTAVWKDVYRYMSEHHIEEYSGSVGTRYLFSRSSNDYKFLSPNEKRYVRAVSILSDFQALGRIRKKIRPAEGAPLKGKVGKLIFEYVNELKNEFRLSEQTIRSSFRHLSVFLKYLNANGVFSLAKLNNSHLFSFVNSLEGYNVESRKGILQKVRQFLKHLYERKEISVNHCSVLSSFKFAKHRRLPSYYSENEISRLLKNVDQANPNGKRDYAMIMLATRLGLRSSDIIGLQFENLIWERELIVFVQKKTKQKLELPLLPEVGETIINYLKHGRPQSKLPNIFLSHKTPYCEMSISNFNSFLKKYLLRAGIQYDERRHGPHALRHSLATSLLNQETPLPIISAVLGHASPQSTMCYLKIDVNALRKCALEVPAASGKSKFNNK